MINGSGESGNDAFAFFSGLFCRSSCGLLCQPSLSAWLFCCFFITILAVCGWLWVVFSAHNHFFIAK